MTFAHDRFRLHAYVDDELTPDEVDDVERALANDADAMAEVASLRAMGTALHARYDGFLASSGEPVASHVQPLRVPGWRHVGRGAALAATVLVALVIGSAAGWTAHGFDRRDATALSAARAPDVESRLQSFVRTAEMSHAVFVPEIRHPVEVSAADEAHLVAWLSKRLAAPLVVPELGDAGWSLLGGRLLPGEAGPVAQFMYQDRNERRMTLAVSKSVAGPTGASNAASNAASNTASNNASNAAPSAFRIADEGGNTVFYWIDADYAYALTGKLSRGEMTDVARRVYAQLDRPTTAH